MTQPVRPFADAVLAYALYRHFDKDGALLYVGISRDPERRWAQHRTQSGWADVVTSSTVTWFVDEQHARAAERAAIAIENPIHNRARPLGGEALRRALRSYGITPPEDIEWITADQVGALTGVPAQSIDDFIDSHRPARVRRLYDATRPTRKQQLRYNAADVRSLLAAQR